MSGAKKHRLFYRRICLEMLLFLIFLRAKGLTNPVKTSTILCAT